MTSLDDELALFDQEISSIVDNVGESTMAASSASNPTANVISSGTSMAAPRPPPALPIFMPRTMGGVHGSLMAPPVPFGAAAALTPNLLVPHQLRVPTGPPSSSHIHAPLSTIESKPQLYSQSQQNEAETLAKKEREEADRRTLALPSDVELAELKRAKERNQKNSYLGQVQRGEKKMKRFVRCAGGETWEDPSLADWDPNDFRIFCGDLGNEVSDELLAKAFRKYPSFQKAKVVRDSKSNKSKGFGFVSFKSQEDFIRAMREMDGKYVGNRPVKLRKSNWKVEKIASL